MKFLFFILAIILLLTSACEKEDKNIPIIGCCGTEAIFDSLGNTDVHIPNIFTPNNDGINDRFAIFGDSIRRIVDIEIRDYFGRLIFKATNVPPNGNYYLWDGTVEGRIRSGLYYFTVTMESEDGTSGTFKGSVCNYTGCGEHDRAFNTDNCHFPIEYKCWLFTDLCSYPEPCFLQ